MKKIIFLTFLMLPFLGISQVFTNGTFDANVTGWTNNGGSSVDYDGTEGDAALGSLKLTTVAANGRAQSAPNSSPGIAGDYLLTFKVKGADGTKIQGSIYQGSLIGGLNYTIEGTDWQEFSHVFTGVTDSNMNIRIIGKDASSIYFIDDVSFVKVSSVTENSFVANPDFETAPITDAWTMNFTDTDLSTVTGNGGGSAAQITFNKDITNQSNNMLLSGVVDFGQTVNPATVDATFDALAKNSNIQIQLSIRTYDAADATLETLNGAAETVAVADTWEPFTFSNAVTKPFNKIIFRVRIKGTSVVTDDYAAIDNITATFTYNQSRNYWLDVDTDWANTANWTYGTIPIATDNVHIETGATNDPIIGATTGAVTNNLIVDSGESLTITGGGSLIVSGTSSGNVTYNRTLTSKPANADGWHLVSSPVAGEVFDNDYVTNNSIASGSGNNRGVATYSSGWTYLQDAGSISSTSGIGYSMKRSADGSVGFTGTLNTADVNGVAVSASATDFVLLGVPYTAYMSSADFLTANANLDQSQIWVWEQGTTGGNYIANTAKGDNFILAPGQGFFVKKASTGSTVDFAESNQQSNADTFKKSSRTEVKLLVNDGKIERFAKMYYLNNVTKGYDVGYEGESFGGVETSFDVFSHLVEDNQGKNYQVQSLPLTEMESTIVPLGLKLASEQEITISVEALNLPSGIKVFLEDRINNTFTRLDEANTNYKVTPAAGTSEGRFFLHTKSVALSTDSELLNSVSIYKSNATTLRIVGLSHGKAHVKLFNLLGKQVMNSSFNTTGVKELTLPNLATGVYIVQLKTEAGKLNKKIVLE